jgi:nucleoid-associated protein YgaU
MQVYSNCFNISVDGSSWVAELGPFVGGILAFSHESQVLQILNNIGNTWSGYELFTQIYLRGVVFNKNMVIVPYSLADRANPNTGAVNAIAQADNMDTATAPGVREFFLGSDNPNTPQDERFQTFGVGQGGGSNVHVHFSPDIVFSGTAGVQSDEILFHEMVHALREMQGEFEAIPTGDRDKTYDNLEEFFAVLMTNIYISEKNPNASLRKDHQTFNVLSPAESTSDGFLLNNPENLFWIKLLYPQETGYFLSVASNPLAAFNPIRAYLINQPFYDSLGSSVPTTSYTVQPGDTLSGIAQSFYGDPNKWPLIYAVNRTTIGPNPNLIFPGQVLAVPVIG